MKNALKRSLSLLLAITIIFSSAYVGLSEVDFGSLFAVKAKAAGDVESIEFNPIEPIVLTENEKLSMELGSYWDEESGKNRDVFFYIYDYDMYSPGNSITVNYADGTSDVITYSKINEDDEFSPYNWFNSVGERVDVSFDDDQCYENQWSVGTNYVTVCCLGAENTIPVTIVESPIESVSFISDEPIVLLEDTDGHYNEYEDFFEYDYWEALIGCSLNVVYKDGTEKEIIIDCSCGSSPMGFGLTRSEIRLWDTEIQDYCFGYIYDLQGVEHWKSGTNYITISYLGASVQVPVSVIENPVESISYTPAQSMNYIKDDTTYGSFSEYYDWDNDYLYEWFKYEYNKHYGDALIINYNDGSQDEYVYGYSYESDGEAYINSNGEEIPSDYLSFSSNQEYDNQWVSGNTYEFVVSYAGKESTVPVKIVEIASYSFVPVEPIVLYEGYLSDSIDVSEEGNVFTINFTDGSKTNYTYGYGEKKGSWGWFDEAGCELNGYLYAEALDINEWGVGEHTATLIYENYFMETESIDIDILVKENPIKSISVNLSKPIEFIEGYNCYTDTDSDGETYNRYCPNIDHFSVGSTVTVDYKDGTSEVYTFSSEWDEESLQYYPIFETETGKSLGDWNIYDNEEEEHWTVGENYFTFSVYGVSTQISATVKENPIESLHINVGKDIVFEENTNGWFLTDWIYDEENDDWSEVEFYYYNTQIQETGMELIINYTDGTTDTFVCTVYEDEGYCEWVNSSGDSIDVEWYDNQNQSYETRWGIGTHYITVSYYGKELKIPVEIISAGNCTHANSEWVIDKASTCTENGSKHKECTVCGEVLETAIIEKPGHSYSTQWTIDVAPTCTKEGSKSHHCTVCGDKTDVTVIVAKDHTAVKDAAVSATCTTAGKTEGSHCSVCNTVIKAQTTVPAKGHTSSDWIVDKEATVSASGTKYKKCTVCGAKLETATIPQLNPATPKVTSTNAIGGVQLSWNKIDGAVKYVVYRRNAGQTSFTQIGTTTSTTFLDKNVKSGQYYCYTVRAFNAEGGYSAYVYANTSTRKYMATPKLTTIYNHQNGLAIKWNAVAGVTNGYRVYRRGAGSTSWTYLGTTKNLYFIDSAVKNRNGEYFRYTVIADGGYHSKFDTTGLYLRRLANPTLNSAVSSKSGIRVKWGKVAGSSGYYVYRKTANSTWTRIAVVKGVNGLSYLDKTAKKGTTYTYTVRAVYGNTLSSYYSGISCKDKY